MTEQDYTWLIQSVSSALVRTMEEVKIKAKTLNWLADLVETALREKVAEAKD